MFRRKRQDERAQVLLETLVNKAQEWERLAALARQREDKGPANTLRECRVYPEGFWQGTANGLETAAKELRDLIEGAS